MKAHGFSTSAMNDMVKDVGGSLYPSSSPSYVYPTEYLPQELNQAPIDASTRIQYEPIFVTPYQLFAETMFLS